MLHRRDMPGHRSSVGSSRLCGAARRRAAAAPVDEPASALAIFPRTRSGLYSYYALVASRTGALKCARPPDPAARPGPPMLFRSHLLPRSRAGPRWMFDTESADLNVEHVRPRDTYETPSWIWEHYVASERLTVDAHSAALNAVSPRYITAADRVCVPKKHMVAVAACAALRRTMGRAGEDGRHEERRPRNLHAD